MDHVRYFVHGALAQGAKWLRKWCKIFWQHSFDSGRFSHGANAVSLSSEPVLSVWNEILYSFRSNLFLAVPPSSPYRHFLPSPSNCVLYTSSMPITATDFALVSAKCLKYDTPVFCLDSFYGPFQVSSFELRRECYLGKYWVTPPLSLLRLSVPLAPPPRS